MISRFPRFRRPVVVSGMALLSAMAVGCSSHVAPNPMNSSQGEISFSDPSRDLEPPSKLSPALQFLTSISGKSRDLSGAGDGLNDPPSSDEIGDPAPGTTDVYEVAIHVAPEVDLKALTAAGASIQMRLGDTIYATVHVADMTQLSEVDGVNLIAPMPASQIPTPPKMPLQSSAKIGAGRDLDSSNGDAVKFDHRQLTGKGVIVGIVDTGIDWRHTDFMNSQGKTRIIYLWDIFDNSWDESNHTIGTKPPMNWSDTGKAMGTVYTQEQINAAVEGQLKIPRTDSVGHGTACAGTAAGNDLGVAPDADLVIVNSHRDDIDNKENDGCGGVLGAYWITQIAAQRNEPCSISLSFGGHECPHDGTAEFSRGFNLVVNDGELPGASICASAGNEGEDSMHARGRFGPARKIKDQKVEISNGFGTPIELFVTKSTTLAAIFDSRDDWMLRIAGLDKFLAGTETNPAYLDLYKSTTPPKDTDGLELHGPKSVQAADQNAIIALRKNKKISLDPPLNGSDFLKATLPPGSYVLGVTGRSEKVTHGVFDLYLPDVSDASFGRGADHKMIVGSPGDADDVITVGSYDFRNQWENVNGTTTYSDSISPGNISAYSSEGFRRDGAVKPDIAAPGQFTISALAVGSTLADDMGGSVAITKDGKHVAWAGTSASCPYTAGVIALMLQKNPRLTENQIKRILRDTADHDFDVTGAVPNGEWGYGKLNAEKALDKVPPPSALPPTTQTSPVGPADKAGFAGTFKGDGLILELIVNPDGSLTGSMVKNNLTFPITAHVAAGQLEATATSNGQDFPFSAVLDGDKLTLQAGDKSFVLSRQDAPRGIGDDWLDRSISPEDSKHGASRDLDDGHGLTLKPVAINDPMIANWPAVTFLIPDGWSFRGSIHWNQDPWTMVSPVVVSHAPGGFPGIMVYPQGSYIAGIREQRLQMTSGLQGADQWIDQGYGEGKFYMGKEIRVFAQPVQYIKQFVIPLSRQDLGDAQVVSVEDAPKFGRMFLASDADQTGQRVSAVKVRFQYEFRGQAIDEDMYCAIVTVPMPAGVFCWTSNVISFAAPRGTLDQNMSLMTSIVASAKPQLKWVNACAQVRQMMQQNIAQAVADDGALSQYISRVNDEISDIGRQEYAEQQKAEDRVDNEWHEYIAGVNTYAGPDGPVDLPNSGTTPWFVDPNGIYHQPANGEVPDDSWKQLQAVEPGDPGYNGNRSGG